MSGYDTYAEPPQHVGGAPVPFKGIHPPLRTPPVTTRSPVAPAGGGHLVGPAPLSGQATVLVSSLKDAAYKGRRVRFRDGHGKSVEGKVQGIAVAAVLKLRVDGTTTTAGERELHLVDNSNKHHYLPFRPDDRAELLDC
ncbi:hypothetical protein ACJH6J_20370 [Mycobacterium sp. SMC-18]|uniref:hypothetical protein n=1 Tax=unclassified Mycobacterium TaxID=2642494 RepID=UPI0038777832